MISCGPVGYCLLLLRGKDICPLLPCKQAACNGKKSSTEAMDLEEQGSTGPASLLPAHLTLVLSTASPDPRTSPPSSSYVECRAADNWRIPGTSTMPLGPGLAPTVACAYQAINFIIRLRKGERSVFCNVFQLVCCGTLVCREWSAHMLWDFVGRAIGGCKVTVWYALSVVQKWTVCLDNFSTFTACGEM